MFFIQKMDDLSSDMLRSFGEYSSLDSSLNECISYQEAENKSRVKHPVTIAINKLLEFQASHHISNAAVIQMARNQNGIPGSAIEIPLNKKEMDKRACQKYCFEYYVFCQKCKEVTKYHEKCAQCNIVTAKTRDNFFIYIPIKQQLMLMLHKNLNTILKYLEKERAETVIGDIYDGEIYKQMKSNNPGTTILSLTFNLDGASVSNSSKSSIWPILLYQNYLPPSIRFMKENVLLVGVITTIGKPDLTKFLLPFIIEMNELYSDRISLIQDENIYHFLPFAMYCLCDLPARAELQQLKYISGYFACPICIQKGTSVSGKGSSKYVRYVKTNETPEMRTHAQTISDISTYLNTAKIVNGVKGITPLIALPSFDIIDNVSTDHMHGVFLGVMSDLIDIWMGKKNLQNIKSGFKIKGSENRAKFNNKIVQLKPHSRITRKPRSLFDRSFFKAVEYRNLLWFYVHYALYGVLSQTAINHFDLLSASTYILNKTEITKEEIVKAGQMLEKFTNEFEDYYGIDGVTMNLHILRHYSHNVLQSGPLWSQSMMGFESRIGDFKLCHRSKVCISESIAKKYCLSDSKCRGPIVNENIVMLREKSIDVGMCTAKIFMEFGFSPTNGRRHYNIAYEIRKHNEVFKSLSSQITKSIDYFVKLKDETIGAIELFVKNGANIYILLQKYEIVHQKYHFNEVKLKTPIQRGLFNFNEIHEKLIYLKFGSIEVVTSEPNKYEKT